MDVEVTGLPEPEVKWFKDDILIQNHPRYKLQQIENCYKLIIDQSELHINILFFSLRYILAFYLF